MPTIDALTHDSIFILAQPNSKSNSQTEHFPDDARQMRVHRKKRINGGGGAGGSSSEMQSLCALPLTAETPNVVWARALRAHVAAFVATKAHSTPFVHTR